jgi:hypothetical protein
VSASDCRAVGYFIGANSYRQTLIEHWNGTSWALDPSPNTSAAQSNYLYGVTCVSAANCWAVGYGYTDSSPNYPKTLIERWDGTSWAIVSSPNPSIARTNETVGVTCPSASDCWAVGAYLASPTVFQTLAERYTPIVPPIPTTVVSRKTHGTVGTFDVDLTNGNGIECRSGGTAGDYTMVFTFANTLTSIDGASVSSGTGSVSNRAIGADAHQYIVDLTGVSNAQTITVSLTNVNDSAGNSSSLLSASMAVLLGDVNANGNVSNTDVASVKAQVGASVDSSNFRNDVNANGIISNTDVSATKAQVGTRLPP